MKIWYWLKSGTDWKFLPTDRVVLTSPLFRPLLRWPFYHLPQLGMDTSVKYWRDSYIWEPCSVLCLLPGNLLQPLVQRWGDQPGNRISNFWSFSPHLSSGFQSFDVFSPRVSSGQQLWCSPSHSDQILASTLWSFWRDKHKSNCWRRTGRMFSPGIIGEKAFIIECCNGNGGQALCAEWWKSKWVMLKTVFCL